MKDCEVHAVCVCGAILDIEDIEAIINSSQKKIKDIFSKRLEVAVERHKEEIAKIE